MTGYGPVVGARLADPPRHRHDRADRLGPQRPAVAAAAAESLKRVHLELGGKAPVVVFADADLPAAAASLRAPVLATPARNAAPPAACSSTSRWPTTSSTSSSSEVASLVVGEPGAGDDVEIGPLVSKAHFDRVVGYLERAVGRRRPRRRRRRAAGRTRLLRRSRPCWSTCPDGAACTPRGDLRPGRHRGDLHRRGRGGHARQRRALRPVRLGLDRERPRAATTSPRRLDFGTVWVNAHLVLANEVPWGGFKGSGYGRDLSIYALDDYSRTKHVMVKHRA